MSLRHVKETAARNVFLTLTCLCCLLIVPLVLVLAFRSIPVLKEQPLLQVLFSTEWAPLKGKFGMLAFLSGTVFVTGLAMFLAVPVSVLTAIFLSEYAPRTLKNILLPLVDLLSGIPSVVYGVVGVLVVVPAVARLSSAAGGTASGYSLLAGGIVLAVMVSPFIINVAVEVLSSVPESMREASLSLGATEWQTVKHVVLRKARPGIAAAVMLGFARAVGETIAVLMVVGNIPQVPRSLFDPAYPLPALLANNYGEMMSIPFYESALMLSALVLLAVVLCFNLLARAVLLLTQGRTA